MADEDTPAPARRKEEQRKPVKTRDIVLAALQERPSRMADAEATSRGIPQWVYILAVLAGSGGVGAAGGAITGGGTDAVTRADLERIERKIDDVSGDDLVTREDLERVEDKIDKMSEKFTKLRISLAKLTGEDPG